VLPTEVVDVREESLHRVLPSELAVGTSLIVRPQEVREGGRPRAVAAVWTGIGSAAQQDADECFGLAVPARVYAGISTQLVPAWASTAVNAGLLVYEQWLSVITWKRRLRRPAFGYMPSQLVE
jgi:hypothetical protein